MKLLIVEDEPELLRVMQILLQGQGHEVQVVLNGVEAWETYQATPEAFDAILSDVMMPLMNGLELLQRVRNEQYNTPVILITGHNETEVILNALQYGAFDFIIKPFRKHTLAMTLQKLEALCGTKADVFTFLPKVTQTTTLQVSSQLRRIRAVVAYLRPLFEAHCNYYRVNSQQLCIALYEALSNAIIHGNLNVAPKVRDESMNEYFEMIRQREADPQFAERLVNVSCLISREKLEFEIIDQGQGFDYQAMPQRNLGALLEHGRGILMMRSIMDQVHWQENGRCIRLIKYWQTQPVSP